MNYKCLHQFLPVEIIRYIGEYDNASKKSMNSVIEQLNEYNNKVTEYELEQHDEQYSEWLYGDRYNPNLKYKKHIPCPYLLKNIQEP